MSEPKVCAEALALAAALPVDPEADAMAAALMARANDGARSRRLTYDARAARLRGLGFEEPSEDQIERNRIALDICPPRGLP